jgi:hypothetical protein
MTKASAWSLRGVSSKARNAARASAKSEGVTLGIWLGSLIQEVADAEGVSVAPVPVKSEIPEQVSRNEIVATPPPQTMIAPKPQPQRPARTSSIERAMMKMPVGNSEVTAS